MSDALQRHRALERELVYIRWKHAGLESEEEESILDAMEEIWYELSEEEQNELNSEGTKSLIRDNDDNDESPWIVIECARSDCQQTFSLSSATVKKLQQIHDEPDEPWVPARVSVDRHTKHNVELIFGDLIQQIAPILTDLTLEQIASQGGLILHDLSSQKKIKWPELKEL